LKKGDSKKPNRKRWCSLEDTISSSSSNMSESDDEKDK